LVKTLRPLTRPPRHLHLSHAPPRTSAHIHMRLILCKPMVLKKRLVPWQLEHVLLFNDCYRLLSIANISLIHKRVSSTLYNDETE
jgi:hypothetical protein